MRRVTQRARKEMAALGATTPAHWKVFAVGPQAALYWGSCSHQCDRLPKISGLDRDTREHLAMMPDPGSITHMIGLLKSGDREAASEL
jgi:hypothetical protein